MINGGPVLHASCASDCRTGALRKSDGVATKSVATPHRRLIVTLRPRDVTTRTWTSGYGETRDSGDREGEMPRGENPSHTNLQLKLRWCAAGSPDTCVR